MFNHIHEHDLTAGLAGLPEDKRELVRDLAWYYDNLGALVVHEIVDVAPIAGYLGGSVIVMWEQLSPLVDAERERRKDWADPARWQAYFENLYLLVRESRPSTFRSVQRTWRLPS